ncbi:MAG: hypothetical protein MN733_35820, partial [Nitrososphaera sp.]|nr:hypothetical protein [Nitrososphaera sp.]
GADKMSHFMQQGFMLQEISQKLRVAYATEFSKWTEGLRQGPIRAPQDAISRWLQNDQFTFYGFSDTSLRDYYQKWGNIGGMSWPARPSLPDHNVNFYGMDFWNSLRNNANGGFKINICDFIKDLDAIVER